MVKLFRFGLQAYPLVTGDHIAVVSNKLEYQANDMSYGEHGVKVTQAVGSLTNNERMNVHCTGDDYDTKRRNDHEPGSEISEHYGKQAFVR